MRTGAAHGISIITFCPLAEGLLTNRYLNGIPEDDRIRKDGRFLKKNAISEETIAMVQQLGQLAELGAAAELSNFHGGKKMQDEQR